MHASSPAPVSAPRATDNPLGLTHECLEFVATVAKRLAERELPFAELGETKRLIDECKASHGVHTEKGNYQMHAAGILEARAMDRTATRPCPNRKTNTKKRPREGGECECDCCVAKSKAKLLKRWAEENWEKARNRETDLRGYRATLAKQDKQCEGLESLAQEESGKEHILPDANGQTDAEYEREIYNFPNVETVWSENEIDRCIAAMSKSERAVSACMMKRAQQFLTVASRIMRVREAQQELFQANVEHAKAMLHRKRFQPKHAQRFKGCGLTVYLQSKVANLERLKALVREERGLVAIVDAALHNKKVVESDESSDESSDCD